jgi:hypothetical protein
MPRTRPQARPRPDTPFEAFLRQFTRPDGDPRVRAWAEGLLAGERAEGAANPTSRRETPRNPVPDQPPVPYKFLQLDRTAALLF